MCPHPRTSHFISLLEGHRGGAQQIPQNSIFQWLSMATLSFAKQYSTGMMSLLKPQFSIILRCLIELTGN